MANRYAQDQRAVLFGGRHQPPSRSIGSSPGENAKAVSREMMERQNDAAIDDLESKVSQLKEITGGLSTEIKDSVGFLEMMGIDFDKAGNLMKGTVGQLKTMMQGKAGKSMGQMVG